MEQRSGQLIQSDFFQNTGGLNVSDTAFATKDEQATGGANYDYAQSGGIKKRRGHDKDNTTVLSGLKSIGLGFYNPLVGDQAIYRATSPYLQNYGLASHLAVNLSEDTVAATTSFVTEDTVPVSMAQFNTEQANVMWAAGGGMNGIYGMYSATKVTKNGADVPTGSISVSTTADSGVFPQVGGYRYAVSLRKASTQAESNAVFDVLATIVSSTDNVIINMASLTVPDITKYDQKIIWRSALNGSEDFTTGDRIAELTIGAVTYTDTGTSILSSENVPREGNIVADNSVLPAGEYKSVVVWKRRLVTARGGTVCIGELNQPESWPIFNTITIPSGGEITALGIISFSTDFATDEYLVVFKGSECWVITGNDLDDWSLKFIDNTGCSGQNLIVNSNGLIYWVSSRGIFMFDGSNKPVYLSRPLEPFFDYDGNIDKSKLSQGFGVLERKLNQIQWYLSDKTIGEQRVVIKLDLRLTLPSYQQVMNARIIDGIFMLDYLSTQMYAGVAYVSSLPDDVLFLGDNTGYIYDAFTAAADGGAAIDFSYLTRYLDMGNPNTAKRFSKVIVWVEEIGNWDLTLDYWAGYKTTDAEKNFQAQKISTVPTQAVALWDLAFWDVAYWDSFQTRLKPLVFNLNSAKNNTEGGCIRLQFRQDGANEPVTIAGFSVIYSEVAQRT